MKNDPNNLPGIRYLYGIDLRKKTNVFIQMLENYNQQMEKRKKKEENNLVKMMMLDIDKAMKYESEEDYIKREIHNLIEISNEAQLRFGERKRQYITGNDIDYLQKNMKYNNKIKKRLFFASNKINNNINKQNKNINKSVDIKYSNLKNKYKKCINLPPIFPKSYNVCNTNSYSAPDIRNYKILNTQKNKIYA